jgi:hypothetical protein
MSLGEPGAGQAGEVGEGVGVGGTSVAVGMRVDVGDGMAEDVCASVEGVSAGNTSVGVEVGVGPSTAVSGPQARVARTRKEKKATSTTRPPTIPRSTLNWDFTWGSLDEDLTSDAWPAV